MKPTPKAPAPLTPEQKAEQIARFLASKREAFATGILFNLVQGKADTLNEAQCLAAAVTSVKTADALIEQLYPLPKDEPAAK
jgi:hypothetical protein